MRGPFTVALFQNDGAYASCFTSSSFTETNMVSSAGPATGTIGMERGSGGERRSGAGGSGSGGLSSVSVAGQTASGDLTNVTQSHLSTTSDGPYTLVDGRVGPGVTGVTLVLDDGQDVVTTVADGWFVAWWPNAGNADIRSGRLRQWDDNRSTGLAPAPRPSGPPTSGTSGTTGSSGNSGNTGNSGGGGAGNS